MSTHTTPPQLAQEPLLVDLGPGDLGEVKALLAVENSRTDARPGERSNERWVGARDATGALVACGVCEDGPGGYPELAGITVRPTSGGRGWVAVTARLTREAVTEVGVCTLGMYADNAVARRVYHRLGYRTVHEPEHPGPPPRVTGRPVIAGPRPTIAPQYSGDDQPVPQRQRDGTTGSGRRAARRWARSAWRRCPPPLRCSGVIGAGASVNGS